MISKPTRTTYAIIIAFFVFVFALIPPTSAAQDDDIGLMITVQAGFDSFYKGEHWLPVKVTVANDGPPIEGEIRVINRNSIPDQRSVFRAPISLPTQSNKEVTIYAYIANPSPTLDVEFVAENGELLFETSTDRLSRLPNTDLLYGVVSPDPGEFSFLENVPGSRTDAAVAFLTLADLPDIPSAWNGLDVLILNDVDTAQLNANQLRSLDAWLSTGGQLVITGGANWQKTTAGLADYLPVTISGSESVADLPALAEIMGQPFRDPGPYLITISSLANGTLLLHEEGLPILAQKPYGRGSVYFLALDPRFAPLLDWDGTEALFEFPALAVPANSLWGAAPFEGYAAQNAATSLPQLNLPSVWQMALFLLFYTIIVGPLNYFVLKRRNHLEWAWLTIPALIVGFTAVTYFTGFQLRGNEVLLNQMSVAYSQADGRQARVHSLIGLYSPRRATYDLILPPDTLARPLNNFFGGPGLGAANNEAITFSSENSVDGVRVDVSDVEAFTAQTDRPAPAVSGQGVLNQEGSRNRLEATLQNNSNITLEDSVLILGDHVIGIGDVAPGEAETVNHIMSTIGSAGGGSAPFGPRNRLLTSRANEILGFNYYNDPVLYPRYQFLEALEGEGFSTTPLKLPANVAVLLAWSEESLIDLKVDKGNSSQKNTTLYFIEIPLSQNLSEDTAVTVQPYQLDWSVLAESGLDDVSITNLRLNGGWVELEFQPWTEFQTMATDELVVVLESSGSGAYLAPDLQLWNWREESWQTLAGATWGRTAVANPDPFLGEGNTVRIRLEDRENAFNNVINTIYPSLKGIVE